MGGYLPWWGVPYPTCENSTFPHTTYVGGKHQVVKVLLGGSFAVVVDAVDAPKTTMDVSKARAAVDMSRAAMDRAMAYVDVHPFHPGFAPCLYTLPLYPA